MRGNNCPGEIVNRLGEHQRVPVEGDQVDLAVARALVARHDRKAAVAQVRGGETADLSARRGSRGVALA